MCSCPLFVLCSCPLQASESAAPVAAAAAPAADAAAAAVTPAAEAISLLAAVEMQVQVRFDAASTTRAADSGDKAAGCVPLCLLLTFLSSLFVCFSFFVVCVQEVNNELTRMKTEGNVNTAALLPFQRLLRSIEELKQNGVWCGKLQAGVVPEGQARLNELFEATSELAASMAADDEE